MIVASAGNQGAIASSVITRHSWVIPVAASNLQGKPLGKSNLCNSIGKYGLSAPGENITSLGTDGASVTLSGTSAAAPFVSGAIALLWSLFPSLNAVQIKLAIMQTGSVKRRTIAPPLMNAWAAYKILALSYNNRGIRAS